MTKENAKSVENNVGKKLARRMLDVIADLEPIKKSKGQYEHYKHSEVQSAVMGLLPKHGVLMLTTPSIVKLEDKFVVTMHAKFINCDDYEDFFETSTTVFINLSAKMSPEQLSGSAQSYALKYTLQRTFGLGGEKDPDDLDNEKHTKKTLNKEQSEEIRAKLNSKDREHKLLKYFKAFSIEEIEAKNYGLIMEYIARSEKNEGVQK